MSISFCLCISWLIRFSSPWILLLYTSISFTKSSSLSLFELGIGTALKLSPLSSKCICCLISYYLTGSTVFLVSVCLLKPSPPTVPPEIPEFRLIFRPFIVGYLWISGDSKLVLEEWMDFSLMFMLACSISFCKFTLWAGLVCTLTFRYLLTKVSIGAGFGSSSPSISMTSVYWTSKSSIAPIS